MNDEEILNYKNAVNKVKNLKLKSGVKAIADGEPEKVKIPVADAPKTEVAPKMAPAEKKTIEEVIDIPKPKKTRSSTLTVDEIIKKLNELGETRPNLRRHRKPSLLRMLDEASIKATKREARASSRNARAVSA